MLQSLSNEMYDRMLAFPEIETVGEEEVVACFKVLRKITSNLRLAIYVRTLHFPNTKQKRQVIRWQR
jgi:hypothetical protein